MMSAMLNLRRRASAGSGRLKSWIRLIEELLPVVCPFNDVEKNRLRLKAGLGYDPSEQYYEN